METSKYNKTLLNAVAKGYTITNKGNVFYRGKKRKLKPDGRGYLFISIRLFDGRSANLRIHKLQAFKKYGTKMFEDSIQVRHLNGDSSDNHYDNISIGTQSENTMDIPPEKRLQKAMHATSFWRKYNPVDIRKDYRNGIGYKSLMNKYGISSKGTLWYILNKAKGA